MAKHDIGPKIGIDGEAEFRKQLREINNSLKTLGTEAKALAAEFQGQENSTEALTAQTDILSRQILILKDRLELQNRMLAESVAAYGAADERSQKWQQTVNNTTAEINKLQAQLDQSNAKMAEAVDATGKLTAEIDRQEQELQELQRAYSNAVLEQGKSSEKAEELAGKIRGLSGELDANRSKLSEAGDAFGATGGEAEGLSGILSGSLQVALGNLATQGFNLLIEGAQEAATALQNMLDSSASYADEINTLAAQTGLATDTLQELYGIADLTDVPFSTLQGSLSKLIRTMDNYRSGNAAATEAFEKLGLSMDTIVGPDGQMRNAEDVFFVLVDALGKVQSQAERDAIAMAIFGRGAQELNPIFNMGSSELRNLMEQYKELGGVLSGESLDALNAYQDELDKLKMEGEIIARQISVELAPAALEVAEAFLELARSVDWEEFGKMLADQLQEISEGVIQLIESLQTAVEWWNNLTGASRIGPKMSAATAMWDGGVTEFVKKVSGSNYAMQAAQESRDRSAYAAERAASGGVVTVQNELTFRGDAGKVFNNMLIKEQARLGPSQRTGK